MRRTSWPRGLRRALVGACASLTLGALMLSGVFGDAGQREVPAGPGSSSIPDSRGTADVSVLWIALDEAPLWPLLGTDGRINSARWPGFAELASVSTWYRDTVTTAQWTHFALPSMLSSREPSFGRKSVLREYPDNLFTALSGRMAMNAHEPVTSLCPATVCNPGLIARNLTLPDWVRLVGDTVEAAANQRAPSLHFVHALLPHRPWHLAVDLRLAPRADKDTRPLDLVDRRRDQYQSHLRQYAATDTLIADMLRVMRQSAQWDRTMIVVTADHGLTFEPGESLRDEINPANPATFDDIFRVPLFIKFPGQDVANVSDCSVSVMDVLPTVMATVGVVPDWAIEGTDLGRTCPERSARRVRWPKGTADVTTGFEGVMKRVRFYDTWVTADGDVDGIFKVGLSGSLIGEPVPTTATDEDQVTWSLADPAMYEVIGTDRFSPVPVRATGRIRSARAFGTNEEAILAINGVFVGSIPEIAGSPADAVLGQYFNTNLLTRTLTDGPLRPELWIARWEPAGVSLSRVGPPTG